MAEIAWLPTMRRRMRTALEMRGLNRHQVQVGRPNAERCTFVPSSVSHSLALTCRYCSPAVVVVNVPMPRAARLFPLCRAQSRPFCEYCPFCCWLQLR